MNKKDLSVIIIIAIFLAVASMPLFIWNWTLHCLGGWNVSRECAASSWSTAVNDTKSQIFGRR